MEDVRNDDGVIVNLVTGRIGKRKEVRYYTKASYDSFKERFGKKGGEGLIVHPKQLQRDPNGYRIPSYMTFCALG